MAEVQATRVCTACKQELPESSFHWQVKSLNKRHSRCKACFNELQRSPENLAKARLRKDKHRKSPRYEATRKAYEKSAKYRESSFRYRHSERGTEARREYASTEASKSMMREAQRKYLAANPEVQKAHAAVKRAVASGGLPPASSQSCKCGRVASHYHHHRGYAKEFRLDVVPVCTFCHAAEHHSETFYRVQREAAAKILASSRSDSP